MFHDPRERTVAVSVWIISYSVGGAIGPLLGGVLLEHFRWGSVFLLSVPVMALLLDVGPGLLPEYRDPAAGRLDLASAALSLVAVLAVIYGLKRIAEGGAQASATAAAAIAVGLVAGVVFVRRQKTLADPLIDLRLFRVATFSASLATYALSCFVAFGSYVFIAQYLQLVLGLSPLRAGLWTLPWSVGFVVGSLLAPALARRVPAPTVMAVGLLVAAAGFAVLARAGVSAGLGRRRGVAAFLPRIRSRVHSGQRHDHHRGAARTSRGGGRHLRDQRRARRSAGHRDARQHRHGRVPRADGAGGRWTSPPTCLAQARSTLGGAAAVADRLPTHAGAGCSARPGRPSCAPSPWSSALCAALAVGTAVVTFVLLQTRRGATRRTVVDFICPCAAAISSCSQSGSGTRTPKRTETMRSATTVRKASAAASAWARPSRIPPRKTHAPVKEETA